MARPGTSAVLTTALIRFREELGQVSLELELPEVAAARAARTEMVDQLENYAFPRLVQVDAPMLAVVGGSTGVGKSTLVNSLVGEQVTLSGVLRPTTRSPVLVHHPDDAAWFSQESILPDLRRTTTPTQDAGALHLAPSWSMPQGLALLDAPDVDSVDADNRALAAQLLAAADLWIFVTSAARYADQVPWDFLRAAAERSASVAIVLDRTRAAVVLEVRGHLARMLSSRGLNDSPLFVVPEAPVDDGGLLPKEAVADVSGWLDALAADAIARSAIVDQTLDGAIRQVAYRTHSVADAVIAQQEATVRLRTDVEQAYDRAAASVEEAVGDGTLLRGDLLARWQEFVGAGEVTRRVESHVSRIRDRLTGVLKDHAPTAEQVSSAVEGSLQLLLLEHAGDAAHRVADSWGSHPSGQQLLAGSHGSLARASRDFRDRADRGVRDWQADLLDLIRTEGADKRASARFLAYGVNGLGVALMVVVLADSGSGTAVVGQRILDTVFGEQAVRRLTDQARADLLRRAHALLDVERSRYLVVLDSAGASPGAADRLRDAIRAVDDARVGREGQ